MFQCAHWRWSRFSPFKISFPYCFFYTSTLFHLARQIYTIRYKFGSSRWQFLRIYGRFAHDFACCCFFLQICLLFHSLVTKWSLYVFVCVHLWIVVVDAVGGSGSDDVGGVGIYSYVLYCIVYIGIFLYTCYNFCMKLFIRFLSLLSSIRTF